MFQHMDEDLVHSGKKSDYFSFGNSVINAEVRQGSVATLQNLALLYFCHTEAIEDLLFKDFSTKVAIFFMQGFSDASV